MLFNAVFIRWQKFKERIFHLCYRRITTQRGGIQTAPDPDAVNQYAKLPSRFLGIFLVEKMFQEEEVYSITCRKQFRDRTYNDDNYFAASRLYTIV